MTNHAVPNRADLREHTKTISRHGDRRGQIADFRDSFETINCLYLLFKCGIKTKTYFEWLLWHWASLGQLNLEPTRPNGLLGCKVPTDLVKISVKEATHIGFSLYNITKNVRLHSFSKLRNGDFTTYWNRHHTMKKGLVKICNDMRQGAYFENECFSFNVCSLYFCPKSSLELLQFSWNSWPYVISYRIVSYRII